MRFNEFKLTEAFDNKILALQKELKAAGANLGTFGPKGDGLDGRMGKYTRRAAEEHPEIASKYKDTLSQPDSIDAQKIDTTTIQDPDFKKKVVKVANALGVDPNNLMAIMKQESGVNPQARNASGATGLIQFMPKTAQALGTTTDDLYKMDGVQQLDYVYKYFKWTGVGDGSLGELYTAVFMPKYVGYPKDTILGQKDAPGFSGKVYAQNSGLDRDHDGKITKADIEKSVSRFA